MSSMFFCIVCMAALSWSTSDDDWAGAEMMPAAISATIAVYDFIVLLFIFVFEVEGSLG